MVARLLFAFALFAALGAADGDGVDFACPKGSVLRESPRGGACETRGGVGEGPFWARHSNGALRLYGISRHGETEGRWTSWHPNGAKSIEAQYRAGQLVGSFRMWTETGQLVYAGTHDERGEMDGTWTRWWPNGNERIHWEMRHGVAHGPVSARWEGGAKRFEGQRQDGLREGEWTWWDEQGAVVAHCRYQHDAVVEGTCGELR